MVVMTEDRAGEDQGTASPDLVTTGQAARIIGYKLDYRDVRLMAQRGEFPNVVQMSARGWIRIPREDVLAKRDEFDRAAGLQPRRSPKDYEQTEG